MGEEAYADRGLAASQLESLLLAEAESVAGPVVAVTVPGRGGVLWRPGDVRLVGPVAVEFERAINALLDGTDLKSRADVRDALLSIVGSRLVADRSGLIQ